MYEPQSLLEAYYSIYEQPEYLEEEYLNEEDQYFYDIAQFLLDEGYTEDDIFELTEEEDFIYILQNIDEAMTDAEKKALSRHSRERLGIGHAGVSKTGKELKGASRERSVSSVRQKRSERQAWDSPTERQKEIARRGRESTERYHKREEEKATSDRMKRVDAEAEREYQAQKSADSKKTPSKTAVGKLKDAAQAGWERHQKATKTAGEVLGGVGRYLAAHQKAKAARAGGRDISAKTQERYARQQAFKGIKEDYFDYVLDYLLENFEFDSEDHLYSTMVSLDEETIEDILDIMEVKGLGGEVEFHRGGYSGSVSPGEERRETGITRSKLVSGKAPASQKDDLYGGSAKMNLTPKDKLRGKMKKLESSEDESPRTQERISKMRDVLKKNKY